MPPLIRRPLPTPFQEWQAHCQKWSKGCGHEYCSKVGRIVLGRGGVPADVLFVGEAPGVSEDVQGLPFVGPAGYLLNRIIDKALQGKYSYCITNLVGCMPTDETGSKSGAPSDDAVEQCTPRLQELYRIARPKLVVAVGKLSHTWLVPGMKYSIKLDGLGGRVRFVEIDHPAFILRKPLVQQTFMERRCVVVLQNALEEMKHATSYHQEQSPAEPTTRPQWDSDDIPF